jgi:O-antigen/teichoic acid export membrane protein
MSRPREEGVSSIAKGVAWTLLGSVASQGSTFLTSILLARLLGRLEYGKLATLQSWIVMLTSVAAIGLGITATKFVAELRDRAPARVGKILGLSSAVTCGTGVACALGLVIFAPTVAELFRVPALETQLRLGSVYVLFSTMNGFQLGALAGLGSFARLARIALVQGPISVLLAVGLTWAFGLSGATLALDLAAILSWIQHQVALRAACKEAGLVVTYTRLGGEIVVLRDFAVPAALAGWIASAAIAATNTILVRGPGGVAAMAVFNVGVTIRILVLFVPGVVSRVSATVLCWLQGTNAKTLYRRTLSRYVLFNTGLAIAAAVVLALASQLLLRLYGKEFVNGRPVILMLLAAAVMETLSAGFYQVLYSHGRIWTQTAILTVWSVVLVAVTAAERAGGAASLAAAYLVAWSVAAGLYALAARHVLSRERNQKVGQRTAAG